MSSRTLTFMHRFALSVMTTILLSILPCFAQEDDPLTDEAPAEESDTPPDSEESAADASAEGDPFAERAETDPIVLAIQDSNPQTADQLARAIGILIDAKRFDVAKTYLSQLLTVVADDAELLKLHEKYGHTWFLRVARVKELAPEGEALARRAWDVVRRSARDPARISTLINALENSKTRGDAAEQLRKGGSAAAPFLIAALGDPNRSSIHKTLQSVLLSIGSDATEPIVAALDVADVELSARLIAVLDANRDRTALPKLVELSFANGVPAAVQNVARRAIAGRQGRLPSMAAVEKFMSDRFIEMFRDRSVSARSDLTSVTIWQLDPATEELVSFDVTPDVAERHQALRVAKSLVALFPENVEYQQWLIAANLEWEQTQVGEDTVLPIEQAMALARTTGAELPVPDEQADPATLSAVLKISLEMDRAAAAIAAANLLGTVGTEDELHLASGDLAPLAEALHSTDPRIQFAAAAAIMRMNPTRSFAGSNRFQETLASMLHSAAARKALIATPRLDEGQTWAGWLLEFGWEADVVTGGSEALKLLNEGPSHEFVLLSDSIDKPPLVELVQLIRQTSGGGEMPIGVICRDANYDRLKDKYDGQPLIAVLPRPHDDQAARFVVSAVASLPGRRMPAAEMRMQYATTALDWVQLTVNSPQAAIYDLLQLENSVVKLLYDSPLDIRAAETLGRFGTRNAQRQLVDIASQTAYSAELRKAAAQAFAQALSQRGVMLTNGEILQQYERYNASATLDKETQQILGSILDALEAPRKTAQASRE